MGLLILDERTNDVLIDMSILDNSGQIDFESDIVIVGGEPYEGPYEIEPTLYAQYLNTKDKTMSENVIINPIPSNYGLIEWNGSFLKVS